jgi:D-alanine-D-alanine ligase-like ATP-grasp enzyme
VKLTPLKIKRIFARFYKMWVDWRGTSNQIYFEHRVNEYREIWRSIAEKMGAKFTILSEDLWELELDGQKTRINNHQLEFDNPVTLNLAGNKPLVLRLLRGKGIPVPDHIVFQLSELAKAYEFLKQHPAGCVIKPANGYGGQGVTTHVSNKREVRTAAILASLYSRDLLMEAQIPGESYRILVIGGKMVHAVCRRGPRLRGDGISKVSDLIKTENIRLKNQNMRMLDVDRDCLFTLKYQNLSLNSIPAKDQIFLVKSVNDPSRKQVEVRTVYNETATDSVCDTIRHQAELAARIVKSDFLGVDIITTNPRIPLEESGGIVNEVNTTPALHHHYDARVEKYPQAAVHAITVLLKKNNI